MAVLATEISVIIKSASIALKYPGGTAAFASRFGDGSYCNDGQLTRVGFSKLQEAVEFVCNLADRGLSPYNAMTRCAEDMIVASEERGFAIRCDWAVFGPLDWNGDPAIRVPACRATNDESLSVTAPEGWQPGALRAVAAAIAPATCATMAPVAVAV